MSEQGLLEGVPRNGQRMQVNPIRHIMRFDPLRFGQTRVDVVGCGSVGARIAEELGKLGVRNLHLWDFDTVSEENIANQPFDLADISRDEREVLKLDAIAARIERGSGLVPTLHKVRIDTPVSFGKVVFLALDTMAARKQIFEQSLRLKLTTDLVIETRMGVEEFRIYGFNPRPRREVVAWESTLYSDENTVENACRAKETVGATAMMTAGLAVTRFLQWYQWDFVRAPKHQAPYFEQIVMLRPLTVLTRGLDDE